MSSSDRDNDENLFASLAGGQAVIDWFGFCPRFHDASLERLEIVNGNVFLAIRAFRMTDKLDAQRRFICDRHALVTLRMSAVSGMRLHGSAVSIIFDLRIRRLTADEAASDWETCDAPVKGDIEVTFDTSIGLYGSIYSKDLAFELQPMPI
ncbi:MULTISPECIES: hypothetical protein [Rhizobium]|uniref:Uncharacterized protein n=1 Tax=Rhizobium leguminosarum bv. trifolii (strain WSM1325) TaxID=395491 RepID=C6ARE5_RHILS|nr:hypothetical protein [Rhizobium leguminosarum]ACS55095.1 conserved hypothetical protein [Rhizobium leguminosarum bv. trifolii WSM1325]MBY3047526.1 hypothetical protein [Rhizobium leguminosarum]RWY80434.1 hypothetical protein EHI48_09955 [Rhizobium leguminosarum]